MFRRRTQRGKTGEPFTYIHAATTITGELKAEGRVRIHGVVRGTIEVEGVLEVAEGGVIEGPLVRAREVKIIGTVTATVEAEGKVEIWSKGRLEGDVSAASLDIEEGATFIGRSEMRQSGRAAALPREVEVTDEVKG
jgi:cytoskeletal protein CcmA (bactofilin family)